nr:AAA family ATPase [Kibdelosporangium sp. MJ126-NF4]CEL18059.1 putative transcriptional regulator [Kibdelosporangium sp. MJ126-NF4]CTQ90712.1 putative transcriptional regulator [Kibdelosporangium sp. MJ126-NF4]
MLHGRDAQSSAIRDLFDQVRRARGGSLVVCGEAGTGKSALLTQVADDVSDFTVLTCAGVESEVEIAFAGLHQALRPIASRLGALPAVQAEAMRGALGESIGPASDYLVSAGTLALLNAAASERPVLLVVDDAQWLDRASSGAFTFAARRVSDTPVAVLFGVRSTDRHALDRTGLPEIRLDGLEPDSAARLLADWGWAPPSAECAAVIAATGGNPLALVELARARSRHAVIDEVLARGTVPLGDRLRTWYTGQLSRLSGECRDLLVVVAAEESGSPAAVLAAGALLGLPASALAEAAGLVEESCGRLRFRHPLLRSAAYTSAPWQFRAAVHRTIAAVLESEGEWERATWHRASAESGKDEALAKALEAAGATADSRGGIATTAVLLRRAAQLSVTEEGRAVRLAGAAHAAWKSGQVELGRRLLAEAPANPPGAAGVLVARSRGLIALAEGDPATAFAQLSRGAELAKDLTQVVGLLFMAVSAAYDSGRFDDAIEMTRRIARAGFREHGRWLESALDGTLAPSDVEPWRILEAGSALSGEHDAHRWLWPLVITWLGPRPRLADEFGKVVHERLRSAGMLTILTMIAPWLADLAHQLGRWREAEETAREGLRFAVDNGQRTTEAYLAGMLARFGALRGDHSDTRPVLGHHAANAELNWALGLRALAGGDHGQAADRLAALSEPDSGSTHVWTARRATADLVEALTRAERVDEATDVFAAFAPWAERSTLPWARSHLHRARALLVTDECAGEHFAAAAAHLEDLPFERARVALLHGEWLRRNRRQREAVRHLRLAVELFFDLGAPQWTDLASAQLRAAGASSARHGSPGITELTPQELQVARLASQGLTNREIGLRLFVSHRTVGYHLHKLFGKLGVANRSQLRDLNFQE